MTCPAQLQSERRAELPPARQIARQEPVSLCEIGRPRDSGRSAPYQGQQSLLGAGERERRKVVRVCRREP